MRALPMILVVRGGPAHDVAARVTVRVEAGQAELDVRTSMRIVEVPARDDTRSEVWVQEGELPRVFYEAFAEGARDEARSRAGAGASMPALRITITDATVHPVDASVRGFRDAGACAVREIFDDG